jgi:hypothetical protein
MEKLFNEKYGGVVDDLAKLVVDKSFAELELFFDRMVTKIFSDGVYNEGRWIAVELYAKRLAERAAKIYTARLGVVFENRIEDQRSISRQLNEHK